MAVLSSGPETGGPLAQHFEGTPCLEEVEASVGHVAGLEVLHCSLVVSPAHASWFCAHVCLLPRDGELGSGGLCSWGHMSAMGFGTNSFSQRLRFLVGREWAVWASWWFYQSVTDTEVKCSHHGCPSLCLTHMPLVMFPLGPLH